MLNQGAVVYAGDRVRLKMQMMAGGVPVPIPADCEIVWQEGQQAVGSNLVFEHADARHDTITGNGGPNEVVVLIDKVSQAVGGQVRPQCMARRKGADGAWDIYFVDYFKLATQPGQRPTQPVTPPPTTGVTPTGMVLTAELVTPTKLPGK